jgi:hypothetical protein
VAAPIEGSGLGRTLTVFLLGFALFATSCAAAGSVGASASASTEPIPTADSPVTAEAAPADGAIALTASTLSQELAGDSRFASVEVKEGNLIIVHWHGPADAMQRDLRARFPDVNISVKSATCSPGRLRDFAGELQASDPAVNITSVSPDGSHLALTLDESIAATADIAGLERKYSAAAGCPVKVQFGDIAPAAG